MCKEQGQEVREALRVIVDDGIDKRNAKKHKDVALQNAMAGYHTVSSEGSGDPIHEAMRQSRESFNQEQDHRRTGASGSRLQKGLSKMFGKQSKHSHPLPDFDNVRRPDRLQRSMTQSTLRGEAALQKIKGMRGSGWLSKIIENRWKRQLGHKLHMAAFFLNPAIQYGKEQDTISTNTDLQDAIRKVISHLVPSIDDQSLCLSQ
ncbi:hypothetical protein FRX31_024434, partial [Thalictrum thalictroides]